MSKKALLLSILAASLVLTACNDPKEANKENFGKAIQEYLNTQYAVCIHYPSSSANIPTDSPLNDGKKVVYFTDNVFSDSDNSIKQMDYLVQKGLFSKEEQKIQIKEFSSTKNINAIVYSPTELGESFIITETLKVFGQIKKLCSGKVELNEVGTFTEPADSFGIKESKVNYTTKITNVAEWASDPQLATLFSGLLGAEIAELEQKTTLILTNEGWKSGRLMKNK